MCRMFFGRVNAYAVPKDAKKAKLTLYAKPSFRRADHRLWDLCRGMLRFRKNQESYF